MLLGLPVSTNMHVACIQERDYHRHTKDAGLQESYHTPLRDGCAKQSEDGMKGSTQKGHAGGGTSSTVQVKAHSVRTKH